MKLDGYFSGLAGMDLTAQDMAQFGLVFLKDGVCEGNQVIPADWVHDSVQTYSENAWTIGVGRNFRDIGYG